MCIPKVWGLSILLALLVLPAAFAADTGGQAADWRAELEAVCLQTDASTTLSSEELAGLIARCDRLAERIAAEPEVVRKVFLKRLQSCRALLAFVLETRRSEPAADAALPVGAVPAAIAPDAPATTPREASPEPAPPDAAPR